MRISLPARLAFVAVLVVFGLGAAAESRAAGGFAAAPAAGPARYKVLGRLSAVESFSASNAWAVGYSDNGSNESPLLVHWNGHAWSKWPAPTGTPGTLNAITATSASDIWVVGVTSNGQNATPSVPLVLHFDGKSWRRQTAGLPAKGILYDVAAYGNTAWAVGATNGAATTSKTLVMHLLKGKWSVVPNSLRAGTSGWDITPTSTTSALALAYDYKTGPILLRWTGHGWAGLAQPIAGNKIEKTGPAHTGEVWAFGRTKTGPTSMLWNGKTWKVEPVAAASSDINAIRPIPSGTEWAVGDLYNADTETDRPSVAHWSGSTWTAVPVASGVQGQLSGVSASAKNNAWAVGTDSSGATLILHYDGKAWS